MKKKRLYIAYGSNLNLPQMERRCPTATVVGTAEIKDYEILFKGHKHGAVATIEPAQGASVPVLVWDIKRRDELALDQYEGYPFFYDKQMMTVEVDGEEVEAMVYIMTDGHEMGYPSQMYLNTILDGYEEAGFDPSAIENALKKSMAYVGQSPEDGFDISL